VVWVLVESLDDQEASVEGEWARTRL
jgi:hypothetical protein